MTKYSFLRRPEVLRICGFSASTLYRLIHKGQFPRSVILGVEKGGSRATAWFSHEVEDWVKSRTRTSISLSNKQAKEEV